MKTREEAVSLIIDQLENLTVEGKDYKWHYGRLEIRELIDFIYESEPKNED
mgnify:CR=1 FL=1